MAVNLNDRSALQDTLRRAAENARKAREAAQAASAARGLNPAPELPGTGELPQPPSSGQRQP